MGVMRLVALVALLIIPPTGPNWGEAVSAALEEPPVIICRTQGAELAAFQSRATVVPSDLYSLRFCQSTESTPLLSVNWRVAPEAAATPAASYMTAPPLQVSAAVVPSASFSCIAA